jgi:hypothetical protein
MKKLKKRRSPAPIYACMPHAHQALGWRGRRGIAPDGGAARGREVRSARSRSGLVGATRRGRGRRPGPRRRATGDRRGTAPRGPAGSGHPGQPPGPATSATDGQRSHSWADTRQRACQSETQTSPTVSCRSVLMGGQGAEFEALGTRTPSRCIVRALTRTRPTGQLNPAASGHVGGVAPASDHRQRHLQPVPPNEAP